MLESFPNTDTVLYDYPHKDYKSLLTGRNDFLDTIVEEKKIDCVLTVFGPMKWIPKCKHVCGFALAQIVVPESPFFTRMSKIERFKWKFTTIFWAKLFERSNVLYTENPFISERVQNLFPNKKIYTVSNYYNQVFEEGSKRNYLKIHSFTGVQFLDITSSRPHKNIKIALDIAEIWYKTKPSFKARFIFTLAKEDFPPIPSYLKNYFYFIGKVDIAQCPSLYEQCDVVFQPTLLECFTATYPEAMFMKRPIVTTDLEFAHGLCGESACYYSAESPEDAASKLYKVATDENYRELLIQKGMVQLFKFNNYTERAAKLLQICESI